MKKFSIILIIILVLSLGLFRSDVSASASLFISPSSGTYYRGNNFTLGFYVSSTENINAVEVTISYDSSRLSIVSCGAVTSTFEMVADSSCPTITVGTTGSYTGGGAQVGYVTFRANGLGNASVTVSGRTAMNGTSVATGGISRTYSIVAYNPIPSAPEVICASHPDSDQWYKEELVELSWDKESYVTGFSYELDKEEGTAPDNVQETAGTGVNLRVDGEGVWYFHIKAQSAGGWSETTHSKIQVDTTEPAFKIEPVYEDKGDLRPEITFEAEDELSNIDYYEVTIDDGEASKVELPYKTPILSVGEHTILIVVYDKAGNSAEKEITITVMELQPPTISELIVENVFFGPVSQRIAVRGTAPPEAKITLQIESDPIVGESISDEEGNWEYIYEEEISDGEHILRAMVEVEGYQSVYSDAYTFVTGGGIFSILPRTGTSNLAMLLFFVGGLLFGVLVPGGVAFYIYNKRKSRSNVKPDFIK
jgi:hypothetical protein